MTPTPQARAIAERVVNKRTDLFLGTMSSYAADTQERFCELTQAALDARGPSREQVREALEQCRVDNMGCAWVALYERFTDAILALLPAAVDESAIRREAEAAGARKVAEAVAEKLTTRTHLSEIHAILAPHLAPSVTLSDGSAVRYHTRRPDPWRRYKSAAFSESPFRTADKWTSILMLTDTGADFDAVKSLAARLAGRAQG